MPTQLQTVSNPSEEQEQRLDKFFMSDEWDARALGVTPPDHDRITLLNFGSIKQSWLKDASKRFIRYSASTKSYASLRMYLVTLRHFSQFIAEQHAQEATADVVTRELLIDYLHYLNSGKGSVTTRHQRLVLLRAFFESANINGWLKTPPHLIRDEDVPKTSKPAPRFIPPEVLEQLNQHLDSLPLPVARMVLVVQECGLRVGELLQLRFDCIEQDSKGDWYLRHTDHKMKKEQVKPISKDIAGVIQEQQSYIRNNLPKDYAHLFCGNQRGRGTPDSSGRPSFRPVARVMSSKTFQRYLQELGKEHDICTASGDLWHFSSHQFRHTVGAQMINNGVPPHIIQRYLGHESPEMTMRYAHIHDETMKKALESHLNAKIVNVSGEVIQSTDSDLDNDMDAKWLRRNVLAQALPNGSCARPVAKGPCPHANACLTCGDFRTSAEFLPQHKKQLKETETIVAEAEKNGWARQAEMNKQMGKNLLKIINTLEEDNA